MNTIDEILELLKVTSDVLDEMLGAAGWTEKTEFTEEDGETLLQMQDGHDNQERSYLEAFLRNVAHNAGITGEDYDGLTEAIAQAGGLLVDYRDQFPELCQKVKSGVSPQEAVVPSTFKAVDETPVFTNPPNKDLAAFLTPEMMEMLDRQAETAATRTTSELQGVADNAGKVHAAAKQYFFDRYLQMLSEKILSPEFEATFTARMIGGFDDSEKKLEIAGVQTPVALLSSDTSLPT